MFGFDRGFVKSHQFHANPDNIILPLQFSRAAKVFWRLFSYVIVAAASNVENALQWQNVPLIWTCELVAKFINSATCVGASTVQGGHLKVVQKRTKNNPKVKLKRIAEQAALRVILPVSKRLQKSPRKSAKILPNKPYVRLKE